MSILADRVEQLENEIQAIVPALRAAQASQGVHEFIIVHLLSQIAELADDRDDYLQEIIQGIEVSLQLQANATREQYGSGADALVDATLAYFAHFKTLMRSTIVVPAGTSKN